MRERQQADHGATCPLVADLGQQCLEGALVGISREQLVAIDEVEQRHRLPAQRVDDMPVIDHVCVLVMIGRAASPQRRHLGRAEEADEPVVVEAHGQPMADQPRRHRVEHLPQREAAARGDDDARLLPVGGAPLGQLAELGLLDCDALAIARIAPADHLVDEAAVGFHVGEVARAAQQQLVTKHALQVAVRAFDRSVLVGEPRVVARRLHAIVGAQLLVAPGEVGSRIAVEIAECRRQAVGAMQLGHPAECPQGILQPLSQCHVTLPAEHDVGVLEAGECEAEVIEPMIEGRACDRDAELGHVGEVGQPHAPRRMRLREHHVLLGAMKRSPLPDAPLQRPTHAFEQIRVTATQLLEHGNSADAGRGYEHRHDLRLPQMRNRIRTPALARLLLLRGQCRIGLDPVAGRAGEPGHRGSDSRGAGLTGLHEQPRLAVGDMAARQRAILLLRRMLS